MKNIYFSSLNVVKGINCSFLISICILVLLSFFSNKSYAQGANCAAATLINMNSVSATITVNAAPNAPVLTGCTSNAIVKEGWFYITATTSYSVVTFANMGSQTAYIYVYSGSCASLTDLACIDVAIASVNFVNFPTVAGQNYYIRIVQADAAGVVSGRVGAFVNIGTKAEVCVPDKQPFNTGYAEYDGSKYDNIMTAGNHNSSFIDNYAIGYAKFNTGKIPTPAASISVKGIAFAVTFISTNLNNGGEVGFTKMKNDAVDPVTASGNQIQQQYKFPTNAFYTDVDPTTLIADNTYVLYPLRPLAITNFTARYTQGWWGISIPVEWNTLYGTGEETNYYGWNSQYYPYIVVTWSPICTLPTITTQPASNVNQCQGNDFTFTVTATGTAPLSYQWMKDGSPVNGATNSDFTLTNMTPADNGNYTCVITNSCPGTVTSNTSTVNIVAPPAITFINKTDEDCGKANGSVTVNATGGTGTYNYSWNTTPVQTTATISNLSAGLYVVTVTSGPCSASDNITILNIGGPNLTLAETDEHCGKKDGTATATATGGSGTYTYSWSTVPTQTSQTATGLSSGNYIVTVDDGKCTAVQNIDVKEIAGPTVTITTVDIPCNKNGGTATAIASDGNQPYTFLWNTNPPQTAQTINNLIPGNYSVTVTDINNCSASASADIIYPVGPKADFTVFPQTVDLSDGKSALTDNSQRATQWSWKFKGNIISTDPNTVITFTESGEFIVTLIVKDDFGCKDSISKTIVVEQNSGIYIPNSFSPNGDNINDVFLPISKSDMKDSYEMRIFDRWGKEIFYSNDIIKGWDGTLSGKELPQGTYSYRVKYKNSNNKKKSVIGRITLIR